MDFLKKFAGIAHWLPRVSLAAIFLYHGIAKFPMAEGMAQNMGMPVMAVYLLALMEVGGGLLILWGGFGPDWATRISGLILSVVMLGAIFKVHWPVWNNFARTESHPMGGMEFQVLILAISLYFAFKGNSENQGAEA